MKTEEIAARLEIRELADVFANLADVKDAKGQGELFLPDGKLEFQMGLDGDVQDIVGREALVAAFSATIEPCVHVYHLNGQHVVELNDTLDQATGTAYCQATLVNDVDGKLVATVNNVRYADEYAKVDGRWYLRKRRTTFLTSERHDYNPA